jgi:hypothetical protein
MITGLRGTNHVQKSWLHEKIFKIIVVVVFYLKMYQNNIFFNINISK